MSWNVSGVVEKRSFFVKKWLSENWTMIQVCAGTASRAHSDRTCFPWRRPQCQFVTSPPAAGIPQAS
jgi:hypothetical protein